MISEVVSDMLCSKPAARPSARQVYRKLLKLLERVPLIGASFVLSLFQFDAERNFRPFLADLAESSAAHSITRDFDGECDARSESTFKVVAFDALNRPRIKGGDHVAVEVKPTSSWAVEKKLEAKVAVVDNSDGTYSVTLATPCAGLYVVSVLLNDSPIQRSGLRLFSRWREVAALTFSGDVRDVAMDNDGLLYVLCDGFVRVVQQDGKRLLDDHLGFEVDDLGLRLAISEGQLFVLTAHSIQVYRPDGSSVRAWETNCRYEAMAVDAKRNELFAIRREKSENGVDVLSCEGQLLRSWKMYGRPEDIALDASGFVYVIDSPIIMVFDRNGKVVNSWQCIQSMSKDRVRIVIQDDLLFVSSNTRYQGTNPVLRVSDLNGHGSRTILQDLDLPRTGFARLLAVNNNGRAVVGLHEQTPAAAPASDTASKQKVDVSTTRFLFLE